MSQDEDKKSGAGDGQTTEDESSQDSKGESQLPSEPAQAQGNADVDQPADSNEGTQLSCKGQDCTIHHFGQCSCVCVHLHGN